MSTRNLFVISDTHFSHENMLKFTDDKGKLVRGDRFSSVSEMDEIMIANWNSVVNPGDRVYHLGDVFFGDKERFKSLWPRLNGRKDLIVGNHDDIKFLANGGFFRKIHMWKVMPDHNLLLSHVPVHPDNLKMHKRDVVNVHGHTHVRGSPKGPYVSVCVELRNYTPVNIEDISKWIP